MNRNNLAASLTFCAALVLNGCGGAGNASGGGNAASNRQQPEAVANATPAANNAAAASPSASPSAPIVNASSPAPANATPGAGGDNKAKAANAPRPQIGSGGNDFFVFTQARAALGADAELKGVSPVIEVKDGVLTLTGTVTTAAQKSRAEQVARGVGGVKAVKNQLRVSSGG